MVNSLETAAIAKMPLQRRKEGVKIDRKADLINQTLFRKKIQDFFCG